MAELLQLKTASWDASVQKQQMVALSLALRRLLQSKSGVNLTSISTSEVELAAQPHIKRSGLQQLVQILRLTDAVKFARFHAPEVECRTAVDEAIQLVRGMFKQTT